VKRAFTRAWLLSFALLCAGCPSRPTSLVYDLTRRVAVAERWSVRDVLLFGTPSAEPHQAEGFYREAVSEGGDTFVWAREEAEVSLTWAAPAARAAVVDLAPYAGLKSQSMIVRLNGVEVGRFGLSEERRRYRFSLPAPSQKPGDNRLRFVFAATASPSDKEPRNPDHRHLAAAFYSLITSAEDDRTLQDLLGREAPQPFSIVQTKGVPSIVEIGPSMVRYAIRLPEDAQLRFTPDLHTAARAADGAAWFHVTIEHHPGAARDVWSRLISAQDERPREVSVRLPGVPGDIVRVGLQVGAAKGDRFAWGVWTAPRILGRSKRDLLDAPTPSPALAAASLREALKESNVILIILDAGRAREFSCYGYPRNTTPEIDRIASEGVLFEDAFTPAVYTLGAMASVWTSQYPDRHHSEVSFADRLPNDRLTLAEVLTAAQIRTAGFVANAVAGVAFGFDRGFTEFREVFRKYGSGGGAFQRVLPSFFEANRSRRFFAYIHFREPHFPYDPPAPFDTQFGPDGPISHAARNDSAWVTDVNQGRRPLTAEEADHLVRLYDGNLAFADHEIGSLRHTLETLGLWEKSVVIVAADHGEELHEHGWIGHNVHLFEESIHVPLVIRFPQGKGPKGRRLRGLVDLLDLAPTIADVFGVSGLGGSDKAFQGRSLLPLLAGAEAEAAILCRTVWDRPRYALRDDRFKLLYDTRTGEGQLFDLQQDPGETRDIQSTEVLRTAYLRESLQQGIARLGRAAEATQGAPILTRDQCENLKALGYLTSDFKCPDN
jgi:arylsulfatase A-like enzyme